MKHSFYREQYDTTTRYLLFLSISDIPCHHMLLVTVDLVCHLAGVSLNGSSACCSEQTRLDDQKKWLDQEIEKILEQRRQIEDLEAVSRN